MQLKASYHTLGCKLNYSETATIAEILERKGIERAAKDEIPDLCIVNTCSVTEAADKKARHLIRNLANRFPESSIIVTGCYAQLKPQEVAKLPGVSIVLGSNEKLRISQYLDSWLCLQQKIVETSNLTSIKEFMPSCERGDRTRYFLKVQDGCDYFCSYCTIPYARGRSRSGKLQDIIGMAKDVANKGGKEIVLTGVNIGTFGQDTGEQFINLLKELDNIREIDRYRISSIEPNLLTNDILKWISQSSRAFMPHFHIPLQSGSDKVLKLMRRRYDTKFFKERIEQIHSMIPDAYIGVDIIAGARGETLEEWEESLEFARSLNVSKYHVFPYSERPGTMALKLDEVVPMEERRKRVALLTQLSDQKNLSFIEKNLNRKVKVLWEHSVSGNRMQGLTENYIRVEAPKIENFINTISEVTLTGLKQNSEEIVEGIHIPKELEE